MLALLLTATASLPKTHSKLNGSIVKGRRSTKSFEARGGFSPMFTAATRPVGSWRWPRRRAHRSRSHGRSRSSTMTLVASLAAGLDAGVELLEDASDVGHAHGVALMA